MGYTQKVVIIGAGISGLACAYRLKQLGVQCLVFEAESRPGGVIATARRDGYLFELGPQCPRFPEPVWRLVQELGLGDEFIAGDPAARRYIFRHGALHAAPFSPDKLLTTRLVGLPSKLRVLTEAVRSTQPPEQEETVADFVTRKFGADLVENLVDPVISTVFFGDAYKMGMESAFPALVKWEREHGSLVRGAIRARNAKPRGNSRSMKVTDSLPSLGSFRTGMARLPERLAEELRGEIRFGVRVQSLVAIKSRNGDEAPGWDVTLSYGDTISAEQVVLALPAHKAACIVDSGAPRLAGELNAIEYAPMAVVSSGYERQQVRNMLDGFGFMVPRKERLQTICTFWNSSLFAGRAPEGKVLITSFVRDETGAANDETLARTVEAENARILGITGEPSARNAWRHPQALPQYNVGHAQRVAAIDDILPAFPNLHIAGNYLRGRSIGDCVERAFQVADEVHSQLAASNIQPVTGFSKE